MTDQAGQAAQGAQDTAGQAAGQAQDAAGQATQQAEDAQRAADKKSPTPRSPPSARPRNCVDLSQVEGTGPGGQITIGDVENAAN